MLHLSIYGEGQLDFDVEKIVISGYTARDEAGIRRHIEEMRQEGVAVPELFPVFFPKIADRITTASRIEVLPGSSSCGEAEFVLLIDKDGSMYVGIGSDHSDKGILHLSVLAGKHMYPGVLSKEVWRYSDVEAHWDGLVMRSWVVVDGERQLYQEGELSEFIRPKEYVEALKTQVVHADLSGMAIYCGTLPIIGGTPISTHYFEAQLVDEKLSRSLTCSYAVEPIGWFSGNIQVT